MKTIYYLYKTDDGRLVVDDSLPDGARLLRKTLANNWIAAKESFGFELTYLQEVMINE